MKKYIDAIIPYVGGAFDYTPVLHLCRDLFFTFIFWQIGYRGFQVAFTTMLGSGFWEAGNGVCFNNDGTHGHFDFLDLLPSVFAGFLMVGFLSNNYDWSIVRTLGIIYLSVVVLLFLLNKLLGREIVFKIGHEGASK
jgi:hypothetical protein